MRQIRFLFIEYMAQSSGKRGREIKKAATKAAALQQVPSA